MFVFLLKIVMGLATTKITAGVRSRHVRYVAKYYVLSILFVLDLTNFLMTLLKVLFPRSPAIGITCFLVSILSVPVLTRNLEIIETIFVNNFKKRQYFNMLKILLFNLFFAQFVSAMLISLSFYD